MDTITMVEVGFQANSEIVPSVSIVNMEDVEGLVGGWLIAVSQHGTEDDLGPIIVDRCERGDVITYVAYHGPYIPEADATFVSSLTIIGDIQPGLV